VERADQSLYLSKTRGRNRVSIHFSEKRRAIRYPVRRSSRASIARPSAPEGRAAPVNLSLAGALLATDETYRTAEPVRVTFGGRGQDWVVVGRIVRVEPPAPPRRGRVAVAFEEPLPEQCIRHHASRTGPRRLLRTGDAR
jgi:hypothetical protein